MSGPAVCPASHPSSVHSAMPRFTLPPRCRTAELTTPAGPTTTLTLNLHAPSELSRRARAKRPADSETGPVTEKKPSFKTFEMSNHSVGPTTVPTEMDYSGRVCCTSSRSSFWCLRDARWQALWLCCASRSAAAEQCSHLSAAALHSAQLYTAHRGTEATVAVCNRLNVHEQRRLSRSETAILR